MQIVIAMSGRWRHKGVCECVCLFSTQCSVSRTLPLYSVLVLHESVSVVFVFSVVLSYLSKIKLRI
jgi:hypothetical protein